MIQSKLKANNCNRGQLFRPYWVSSARRSKLYEVISWLTDIHAYTQYKMVMTSDGTRIQILANWPMSHAKRVTRDNRKNPEYHVVVAIRKLRTRPVRAVHGCNCWLLVWTLSCRCSVKLFT